MINWRVLLDSIRVPWRDRGANCSRGHVNITCPWCGPADPSYHLTISEENGAYFCYRVPLSHSGWSLPWLLIHLGVDHDQIDSLVEQHSDRRVPRVLVAEPAVPVAWDRFPRAGESEAALAYVRSRGYQSPRETCRRFDLRFTLAGRFAWRVLFPLTHHGVVTGLTGRAVRAATTPRYLTNDPIAGSLYLPSGPPVPETRLLLAFEGPTDAMAAASQSAISEVCPIGLLGTAIPAERKLHISALVRRTRSASFAYCPDRDQSVSDTYRIIAELEEIPGVAATRQPPPAGYKDVGAMASNPAEVRQWLMECMSQSGRARSRTTPDRSSARTRGG